MATPKEDQQAERLAQAAANQAAQEAWGATPEDEAKERQAPKQAKKK